MSDQIEHRGPDKGGYYIDEKLQIAIGFRRLAMRDISAAGNQPMTSAGGRYVIAFNGEICLLLCD